MSHPSVKIDLATEEDVTGILDLQERNLRDNGGRLSVRLAREWFQVAISDMPVIIARDSKGIVGYAVSTSVNMQADIPIVKEMLRAYPGAQDAYIYGPVCVSESHRNQGLARAMFEELRRRLPGREGFSFIRADNTVSRNVHIKMGMREVARFTQDDIDYVVVAYDG